MSGEKLKSNDRVIWVQGRYMTKAEGAEIHRKEIEAVREVLRCTAMIKRLCGDNTPMKLPSLYCNSGNHGYCDGREELMDNVECSCHCHEKEKKS